MKNILLILILLSTKLNGAVYYFSNSGNDANPGTEAAPFASLTKFNALAFVSGDQALFKCGSVFYGSMSPKSGIKIGSYGTGAKPILTGFTTVTSWTSLGNGLYEATVPNVSMVNVVLIDNVPRAISRWPKVSATNSGYLTLQSHTSLSLTSNAIGSALSYAGGQVVYRASHWVIMRGTITAQTSSTVSFSIYGTTSTDQPANGFGFFFQNHRNACTQFGEWAYTPGKITVYFGPDNPALHTVKVSSIDNVVNLSSKTGVTFTGLQFEGGNISGFNIPSCSGIVIDGCDIINIGQDGITTQNTGSSVTIQNSKILNCFNNGIARVSNSTIKNNLIQDCGMVAGMGVGGGGQYQGTSYLGANTYVGYNRFINCGYLAVHFTGSNCIIEYNYINGYCYVKDDGGGIYTWNSSQAGSKVRYNIVVNGKGAPDGTSDKLALATGIYMDDNANNVEIYGNTLAWNSLANMYFHNCKLINFHHNKMLNAGQYGYRFYNDAGTMSGITISDDTVINKDRILYFNASSPSILTADRNIYSNNNFQTQSGMLSFSAWKTYTGKETSSKTVTTTSGSETVQYNETAVTKTIPLSGNWQDLAGRIYSGSITLAPYTSVILVPSSVTPPPPPPPPPPTTTYYNVQQSKIFTRNNCPSGYTGSQVTYTVPAGKYSSTISQADADSKATADINANGQNYANTNGTCTASTPPPTNCSWWDKVFKRNGCHF